MVLGGANSAPLCMKVVGASAAVLNNQSASCDGDACANLRTSLLTYLTNASTLTVGPQ